MPVNCPDVSTEGENCDRCWGLARPSCLIRWYLAADPADLQPHICHLSSGSSNLCRTGRGGYAPSTAWPPVPAGCANPFPHLGWLTRPGPLLCLASHLSVLRTKHAKSAAVASIN